MEEKSDFVLMIVESEKIVSNFWIRMLQSRNPNIEIIVVASQEEFDEKFRSGIDLVIVSACLQSNDCPDSKPIVDFLKDHPEFSGQIVGTCASPRNAVEMMNWEGVSHDNVVPDKGSVIKHLHEKFGL